MRPLRKALHQIADILADALEEESSEENGRKRKRGTQTAKALPLPPLTAERLAHLEAQVERQRARAGYKKVG